MFNMRNIAVAALSLVLVSSAAAATAPDALVISTAGELRLADGSDRDHVAGRLHAFGGLVAGWDATGVPAPVGDRAGSLRRGRRRYRRGRSRARETARSGRRSRGSRRATSPSTASPREAPSGRSASPAGRRRVERLLVPQADLNLPPALQPGGFLLAYSSNTLGRAVDDVRTGVSQALPVTGSSSPGHLTAACWPMPRSDGIDVIRPDGSDRRTVLPGAHDGERGQRAVAGVVARRAPNRLHAATAVPGSIRGTPRPRAPAPQEALPRVPEQSRTPPPPTPPPARGTRAPASSAPPGRPSGRSRRTR